MSWQRIVRLRMYPPMTAAQAKLWLQKWRWYERNSLPWNRARIHWEFARREAFVRWPVHGNVLEALESRAAESGYRTLHLETTTVQHTARALYTSAGYVEIGRGHDHGFDVIFFEKRL